MTESTILLPPLVAIVDVDVAGQAGWTPDDLAAAYVAGGARLLQIRGKTLSGAAFLELSARVCEMAHRAGALVLVNDRADVARLSGADGVHVGQEDLTVDAARGIVGVDAIVGLSTHTEPQIEAAVRQRATYVAVGPVFGTSTKATGYAAIGLNRVRYAADRLPGAPRAEAVVAIGGITIDNAADVIGAGATAVAVITDLLATGNPEGRVRAYLARLAETGKV
jgi:thiamine-phosphate pyrophosphorylase